MSKLATMQLPDLSGPLQGGLEQYKNSHFVPLNDKASQNLAYKCLRAPQIPTDWNGIATGSAPSLTFIV